LVGSVLAVLLVAGLYLLNRYWITPALTVSGTATRSVQAKGDHPFAPAFSVTDLSGRTLNLADYKGRVVLLDFWATWCGPCRVEIPGFVQLQNRYRDQGLVVIGVSIDDGPEPVREFYKEYKMNYAVAMGSEKLGALYGGILGLPTTFLIGRDGRIYAKHVGATDLSVFEEEIKQLVAVESGVEVAQFRQEAPGSKIELGNEEEVNSEVPGVNLSKLTPAQKEQFKKQLENQPCTCGCKLNLLKCRLDDRSCSVSLKLAREQLDKSLKSGA
jgi:thiol-disulfide isomerase/thioredoxin